MTADPDIEIAVRYPGTNIWVSMEDMRLLLQDEMLYGDTYVERIPDLPENAQVTHRRIPPPLVRAS